MIMEQYRVNIIHKNEYNYKHYHLTFSHSDAGSEIHLTSVEPLKT